MKLVLYKLRKKNSIYLNKECRSPAENQKVLSPDTLDILLPQDFSSVQRENPSGINQRLKVVSSRHLEVHPRYHGGPTYTSKLIFSKLTKADLKFLNSRNLVFHT